MPVDTKRICGPETSFSPLAFIKSTKIVELVNDQQLRRDNRTVDKIRPIFLKTGIVSQAQGSAYIEQNGTKVICSVYGPRAVIKREEFSMKGQLTCEFKSAPFSCVYRRSHQQDSEGKDYSVQLLEALEPAVLLHKFPKAQVNIYITLLQNDGSALAAAITCASVAIADAGIEMYDLVTGSSARLYGDLVLMDPCSSEEYSSKDDTSVNHGSVTVGLMPSFKQISMITSAGEIQFELLKKAINKCVDMCVQLYPVSQQSLIKSAMAKLEQNAG